MKKILYLIAMAIIIFSGLYLGYLFPKHISEENSRTVSFGQKKTDVSLKQNSEGPSKEHERAIAFMVSNIKKLTKFKPELGSDNFYFSKFQFYSGNLFISSFDDGHVLVYFLGQYELDEKGEIKSVRKIAETVNQEEVVSWLDEKNISLDDAKSYIIPPYKDHFILTSEDVFGFLEPDFENFPSPYKMYEGKHADIDFSDDSGPLKIRDFQTRLQKAIKREPNFSGRYIIEPIGCGTGCQILAIIDAQSGRVRFFPAGVSLEGNAIIYAKLSFRRDSNLLIIEPDGFVPYDEEIKKCWEERSLECPWDKKRFFVWKNNQLLEI